MQIGMACPIKLCGYIGLFINCLVFGVDILTQLRALMKYGVNCDRHLFWHATIQDDVIKWKKNPRYWPFVREIHRPPVNSTHESQWRGAYMFSLISACISGWLDNRDAGDLRINLLFSINGLRSRTCGNCMWYIISTTMWGGRVRRKQVSREGASIYTLQILWFVLALGTCFWHTSPIWQHINVQ